MFIFFFFFSGKVYQGNTRLVPDFGIVPIDGFPIDKTVAEIATSTWLVKMEIYLLIDNAIIIIKIKCQKQGYQDLCTFNYSCYYDCLLIYFLLNINYVLTG